MMLELVDATYDENVLVVGSNHCEIQPLYVGIRYGDSEVCVALDEKQCEELIGEILEVLNRKAK